MSHVPQPRVTIEELVRRYPHDGRYASRILIGRPYDVAQVHRDRESWLSELADEFGPSVATDLVLWRLGNASAPYHTKFGGAPYRPAAEPWPQREGRAMTFIAQWCFLDSHDLVPALPGDVLALYADVQDAGAGWHPDDDGLHVEWQKLGIADVNQRVVVQDPAFPTGELHGVLCRSLEYPESREGLWDLLVERDDASDPWLLCTSQSTRIGGATWYVQIDGPRFGEELLCTLSTFGARPDRLDPFLDHSNPLSEKECDAVSLELGDSGCIYLFLGRNGSVRVASDYY